MSRSYLSKRLPWLVLATLFAPLNAGSVELAWDPSPSVVVGYYIYRSGTSGSGYARLNSTPVASCNFKDSNTAAGFKYYYVVKAVNNEGLESAPSNEVEAVVSAATAPNQNPTASAGPDQVVRSGDLVTLSGSGSDPDGDTLSFSWTQVLGPSVSLSGASSATATFTAPTVSSDMNLSFRLTVNDGRGGTASDDTVVTVRANRSPTANAGPDQTVSTGQKVTLAGSGSDPDGDPLTFLWTEVSGTGVTLSGANSATATFTAPSTSGTLVFRLTVSDGRGGTASDDVSITVGTNQDPTADAGPDQTVRSGETVVLSGKGSDPDGDPLTFAWSQLSGPTVTLTGANTATASFTAPSVKGNNTTLTFRLTVNDGRGGVATDDVSIVVRKNDPPTVETKPNKKAVSKETVTLDATVEDPDGDPLQIEWKQLSGFPVWVANSRTSTASFEAPEVSDERELLFQITVSDGAYTVDAMVRVHVSPLIERRPVFPVDLSRAGALFENTFVGVAVMNPRWETNPVRIMGLDSQGTTTANVPLLNDLAPQGQNAFLTSSIFGYNPIQASMIVEGESGPVNAFFMVGDNDLQRMDGIGGELRASRTLFFPVGRATEDESTLIYLFNPSENEDPSVVLRLIGPNGGLIRQTTRSLPASGALMGTLPELFGLTNEVREGYVRVTANVLLKGFLLHARPSDLSSLSGQPPLPTTQFLVPHFFADNQGGGSEIRIINAGAVPAVLRLQFFDDNSRLMGSEEIRISSGRMFVGQVEQLVDLKLPSEGEYQMVTGHIQIDVIAPSNPESAKLIGSINFSGSQGSFSSSLPIARQGEPETVFLQVAQSPEAGLFTGLAVLNPGGETASVTVEAYDQNGNRTGRADIDIPPGHRVVDLLSGECFFGPEFNQVTGHLRVASAQPVVSFVFFGDYGSRFMAAVEGQIPSR
jgi:hypothetical protein